MFAPTASEESVAVALETDGGFESPFPVEGTVTPTEYGYSASIPCASAYLTETEDGTDYLQAAVDRAARKYGEDVEVRVRFTSDRSGMGCGGYELLGVAEEVEA
jgi:hypothetical protein